MEKLNLAWLKAAVVRAIKTAAQTAVGMITVGAALSDIEWSYVLSVAGVAAILSLLTSVAGLPETKAIGTLAFDEKISNDEEDSYRLDFADGKYETLKDGAIINLKIKRG